MRSDALNDDSHLRQTSPDSPLHPETEDTNESESEVRSQIPTITVEQYMEYERIFQSPDADVTDPPNLSYVQRPVPAYMEEDARFGIRSVSRRQQDPPPDQARL
ncbi:MAG: hypothetical protein WCV62_03725 [Candidatus Peribacteraceae bacterium]|jgi:hypothetical protein